MLLLRFDSLPIDKIGLIVYPLGHLIIFLMEWLLLGLGIRLWQKSRSLAMIVLPLLLISLSYDNLILISGNFIGEGEVLYSFSKVRFLLHDLVVPLFIVIGVELAHRAGAAWATTVVRVLSWVTAFTLAGIDINTNYIGLTLVPQSFAGILRYTPANISLPIITIVVNLFMLLIGMGIWIRLKWSWLFVGTLIALLGNAIPSSIVGTLPASTSELVIAISLLLTEWKVQFTGIPSAHNSKPDNRFMINSTTQETAFEWQYIIPKDGYTLYQSGSHINGDFIRVFAPDSPCYNEQGKLKLITYLHGFALCLPKFYEAHLEKLAKQGYYVFFPDFQRSRYPDTPENEKAFTNDEEKDPLSLWGKILTDVISKGKKFNLKDAFEHRKEWQTKIAPLARKLVKPTLFKYFRVALALVVFIVVVRLTFSVFNRKYGKHLINLMSTVGLSLLHKPSEWVENAIALTEQSWKKLCDDNPALAQQEFDFYLFGHSLGGLIALSWPFYLSQTQQNFSPKQVITADPAPSTEMGIPKISLLILKLFNVPFVAGAITIAKTGRQLNVPVAILHGADDQIIKPESWIKPSFWKKKANFDYIASQYKKIYFSLSNRHNQLPLIAFHNQAVTDTTYFDNALFKSFGGVKDEPNAYNYQYIWPGLHLVIEEKVRANELLNKFPLNTIEVTDTLPPKSSVFKWIAILIAMLVSFYSFWKFGIVFA